MSQTLLAQPACPPDQLLKRLQEPGFAVLDAAGLRQITGCCADQLTALQPSWDDLPPDAHLKDGGRYRRRRHACFVVQPDPHTQQLSVSAVQHRAHWQPIEYNALHGGMQRWFEPMNAELVAQPGWQQLLLGLADVATRLKGVSTWFIEAHQFRIDTTDGIGRPTPEGAHRDGVDLVAVVLVAREGIKGGETRVFEALGPQGQRFTLVEPWSALLLDDERVIHESTPIQPLGATGWRDTLVITLRQGGFQGD